MYGALAEGIPARRPQFTRARAKLIRQGSTERSEGDQRRSLWLGLYALAARAMLHMEMGFGIQQTGNGNDVKNEFVSTPTWRLSNPYQKTADDLGDDLID